MALIKCPECGKEVSDKAVTCPNCGYPLKEYLDNNMSDGGTDQYYNEEDDYNQPVGPYLNNETSQGGENIPKKKKSHRMVIIFAVLAIIGIIIAIFLEPNHNTADNADDTDLIIAEDTAETSIEEVEIVSEPDIQTDWFEYYADQGIEVIPVDADILYQYNEYYSGAVVYTAFKVADTQKGQLKAHTDSNDSFFYSIVCYFEDDNEINGVEKENVVSVIGSVEEFMGANLQDCHLVSTGEAAEEEMAELAANTTEQIQYAEEMKVEQEAAQAERDAADKQEYIDACESVSYNDVERNPDDYDGMQIKVSGKVIQVSEGFFNTVTLRVQQSDGNIWYVTYARNEGESRILEGDSITIYGICKGVTSYTNVAGSRITIPSVNAEYID